MFRFFVTNKSLTETKKTNMFRFFVTNKSLTETKKTNMFRFFSLPKTSYNIVSDQINKQQIV